MASFVREILSATGHLGEKEDLCTKATRLKGRVNELKVRIEFWCLVLLGVIQYQMSVPDGSNIYFNIF